MSSPQSFLTVVKPSKGFLMIFADETEEGAVTGLARLTRPDQANYLPWNNNSWRETETGSIKPLERARDYTKSQLCLLCQFMDFNLIIRQDLLSLLLGQISIRCPVIPDKLD